MQSVPHAITADISGQSIYECKKYKECFPLGNISAIFHSRASVASADSKITKHEENSQSNFYRTMH